MKNDNISPSIIAFNTIIDFYYNQNNIEKALQLFHEMKVLESMKRFNIQPDDMSSKILKKGNLQY